MEFDFISLSFGGEQHITTWDAQRIGTLKPDDLRNLTQLLDVFGKKSAVAQGLQTPVTDIHRLRSTDQRLYLYMYRQSSKTVVLGGLKVGTKRLYVRTATAELREIEPTCVLDFYVHESCQRQGVGKALFEHFLQVEGCDPGCNGYDRPSPKLLAFLRKHYGLQDYVPQSNNYVVFNRYFELNPPAPGGSRGSAQGRLNGRVSSGPSGAPHIHPLHGPRSTPQPPVAPAPVHPGWVAPSVLSVPPPPSSAVGPPPPLGQSPSFGRRWAASTFGPVTSHPPLGSQDEGILGSSSGGGAGGNGLSSSGAAGGGADYAQRGSGDALDAFSRAHHSGGSQLHHPHPHQRQQQQQAQGRVVAPWEGPAVPQGAGMPPASRGGSSSYSSRPPWAVDESVGMGQGASRQGASSAGHPPVSAAGSYCPSPARALATERSGTGTSAAARSSMHDILGGGGTGRDGSAGAPHTRALQQQRAGMQDAEGGPGMPSPQGQAQPPRSGGAAPPGSRDGGGSEEAAAAGRGAARMLAVAQRSGAGAADCLVW